MPLAKAYHTVATLVVDDDAVFCSMVEAMLKRIGFEGVDTADNGATALTMMQEKDYGLVISDWNMPEMNGLELLRKVRTNDRLRRTPFVMTSIDGGLERVKIARLAGVSAFMLKPFSPSSLRTKLDEVL